MCDDILLHHFATYPKMQLQDAVKLLYQQAFGCGHLITDHSSCLSYLIREWEHTPAADIPLAEDIGGGYVRLHLAAAKHAGYLPEAVLRMFIASADARPEDNDRRAAFVESLSDLQMMCARGELPFSEQDVIRTTRTLIVAGCPATRHSDVFRDAYHPAYRVVRAEYAALLPVVSKIEHSLRKRGKAHVAIDGRCGAGKSTLASTLGALFDTSSIIHMDHFFLPPRLRTEARYAQPGGNVHYERFAKEVLPGLRSGQGMNYRIFDCSRMAFGLSVSVPPNPVIITEGSYSLRPEWRKFYDVKILLDIDLATQWARLERREDEDILEQFRTRWIPLEEAYFDQCHVREHCDVVLQIDF